MWRGKLAVSWTYWWRIWAESTTENTSTTLRFFFQLHFEVTIWHIELNYHKALLDLRCRLDKPKRLDLTAKKLYFIFKLCIFLWSKTSLRLKFNLCEMIVNLNNLVVSWFKLPLCSPCPVSLLHRVWCPTWLWGRTRSVAGPCTASVSMKQSVRALWVEQNQQTHLSLLLSPFRPSTREASSFLTASQISPRTPTSNCPNGGRHVTHTRHLVQLKSIRTKNLIVRGNIYHWFQWLIFHDLWVTSISFV